VSTKQRDNTGGDAGSLRRSALHRALVMLSYRDRSREEIVRDLSGKGFPDDVVVSIVMELADKELICDLSLARDIVMNGQRSRKSRSKIYSELRRRGIDREDAEESLAACFDADIEREAAVKAMARLLALSHHSPSGADIERAARKLAGRGFSSSAVAYALRDVSASADSHEESAFLDTINKLS
jgi:regulatory protein